MTAMPTLRPAKRIALAATATASGVFLLLALKPHTTATAAIAPATAPSAPSGGSGSQSAGAGGSAGPSGTPGSASGSGAGSAGSSGTSGASGGSSGGSSSSGTGGTRTVDGDTIQTRYGPVQVRVTLTGGKLTGVSVLQVPDRNGRDQEISSFSVPQLTQEALAAQSARIDSVSGATYTSEGYVQSLQSALDKANG